MLNKTSKNATREKIHTRIRKKLAGTTERPRLNVYRSVNHIYVQLIDDAKHATLFPPVRWSRVKTATAKAHCRRQHCSRQECRQADCRARQSQGD